MPSHMFLVHLRPVNNVQEVESLLNTAQACEAQTVFCPSFLATTVPEILRNVASEELPIKLALERGWRGGIIDRRVDRSLEAAILCNSIGRNRDSFWGRDGEGVSGSIYVVASWAIVRLRSCVAV